MFLQQQTINIPLQKKKLFAGFLSMQLYSYHLFYLSICVLGIKQWGPQFLMCRSIWMIYFLQTYIITWFLIYLFE